MFRAILQFKTTKEMSVLLQHTTVRRCYLFCTFYRQGLQFSLQFHAVGYWLYGSKGTRTIQNNIKNNTKLNYAIISLENNITFTRPYLLTVKQYF